MRQPDENREQLWAWLLQRNARMYGVAFSIDAVGDIYLTGRVPLHAVTPGRSTACSASVLTYADESFDTMLEIGFGTRSAASGRGGWRGASPWPTCRPSPIWYPARSPKARAPGIEPAPGAHAEPVDRSHRAASSVWSGGGPGSGAPCVRMPSRCNSR